MYQVVVGVVILLMVILFVRTGAKNGLGMQLVFNRMIKQWKQSVNRITEINKEKSPVFYILADFTAVLATFFFFILALTGFIPVLLFGGHVTGVILIIHVTTAPFFVISFMLALLFRAQKNQFTMNDFICLRSRREDENISLKPGDFEKVLQKIYFWLISVFVLPAILSMILSMYPVFGTGWQEAMLNLHQFSTLVLFVVVMFYLKSKYMTAAV